MSRQNCDCRHDLRWKAATTDCKTSTVLDKGFNLVRQLLPVHEAQLRHMQKAEWLQRLLDSGLEAISSSGTLRTAAMMAFSRADGEERLRLFAAAGAAPVAGMLPLIQYADAYVAHVRGLVRGCGRNETRRTKLARQLVAFVAGLPAGAPRALTTALRPLGLGKMKAVWGPLEKEHGQLRLPA